MFDFSKFIYSKEEDDISATLLLKCLGENSKVKQK